jgi:hypothetical protein
VVHLRYTLAITAAATGFLLAACGKSEPPAPAPAPAPPPAKVEAPAPTVNEGLKRLAGEVSVFAYPLVVMDVTRQVMTAKVPINTFQHRRTSIGPTSTELANPNADVLFSSAWLDLSKEPIVLSVPDTRGRYYVIPMMDAWSNVFSSPGKRTTGTGKGDFAIVGPKWKGELPSGVSEINSPTAMVWLVGRIDPRGKGDQPTATKLLDQFKLTPLSQWGKRAASKATPPAASPAAVDVKTDPVEQVARMDAQTFLTRFAMLLPGNPPASADAPMVEKIARLGVVAGQPFDLGKLDAPAAKAVEEGVQSARAAIVTASRGSLGDLRNGWTIHWDLGRYGTNYGLRAVMAMINLGANAPEDAIFASTRFDAGGKPLNGANRYVLHFDKGKFPPTDAFWALSMYDDKKSFVANPIDRHAIGDRDDLQINADGSLDIYIQNASPGKNRESNWLPAPKDGFNVIMRIYWPKQELLDRRWTPPAIRLVP